MTKRKRRYHFKHSWPARWWRRYQYKHTTLAALAIGLFIIGIDTALVQSGLSFVEELGILGIVIAGILFTSFFTTAPAIVMLIAFAKIYDPLTITFYAAVGSVIGDWIILKVFEEKVGYELIPLIRKYKLATFLRKLKRKKNREKTTLLGMLMIASPLPDEIGIGLLGLSHLPVVSLLIITFLLNAAGILLLVLVI